MKQLITTAAMLLAWVPSWGQAPVTSSLTGIVTDPSGAVVPGAVIQVNGPRGSIRAKSNKVGKFSFAALPAGTYQIRVTARGFSAAVSKNLVIDRALTVDTQLAIQPGKAVMEVSDEVGRVGTEPESNGAIIMRERQLAVLSDDPDELAIQLQALAGPAPGPNGGQVYIDGFLGGNLPPKASIREVRINSNPFSAEYDQPGFARIEVFTKPGSERLRGQAFYQFNDAALNSRNPLLTQSTRPPYGVRFYGLNISGPICKNKASFTLDLEHRKIDENAFILAATPAKINQAVATPQTRTAMSPRLDYALSPKNTLVVRYQDVRIGLDNQGVGDFNLASRAYDEREAEHTVQITATSMLNPRVIDETRFQFLTASSRKTAINNSPGVDVDGAFFGGGSSVGSSRSSTNSWEFSNLFSLTKARHTLKLGGRARQSLLTDISMDNFAGTFTFYTLEEYLAQRPAQFSLNSGNPTTSGGRFDVGLFASDDWRALPNLTVSLGLRYEAQSRVGDLKDWAPRLGVAWNLDGTATRPGKTVLRAGAGVFYDRIPLSVSLNAHRFNGVTQQAFVILNPGFFPAIPPIESLQAEGQPQLLQPAYDGIRAPRLFQVSAGMDRQVNRYARVSVNWVSSRGVSLLNSRNINAPLAGVYPFQDRGIRLLTENAGLSRQNQLILSPSLNYKGLSLSGYYAWSQGKDNNEGMPADPYSLHAEWGPSTYGDVKHRMVITSSIPLPLRFVAMPFIVANSGPPYNIRTGLDPYLTGFAAQRPSLVQGFCKGAGCFTLTPAPGDTVIPRNFGRGPAAVNLSLRLSRTWGFVSGTSDSGSSHGASPTTTNGKYKLTLSASTLNALNHPNFAPPSGNLSSPYFGQYRSLGGLVVMSHGGGASSYNRKIYLQLRLTF